MGCTQLPECGVTLLDFLKQLAECAIVDSDTGLQGLNVIIGEKGDASTQVISCDGVPAVAWEQVLNGCFVLDIHGHKALNIYASECPRET